MKWILKGDDNGLGGVEGGKIVIRIYYVKYILYILRKGTLS